MPGVQNDIVKILQLAKNVNKEQDLQNNSLYKKFKTKNKGHRSEMNDIIRQLRLKKFYNESIFWCEKFLQNRICDKNEKFAMQMYLVSSYLETKRYEKALEFGKKAFEIQTEKTLEEISILLDVILTSMTCLKRPEDTKIYWKEKLKVEIQLYNRGTSEMITLMDTYIGLIEQQIREKEFENAMKTMKNLKFYSLNSKDIYEFIKAMNRDEKIKFMLPNSLKIPMVFGYEQEALVNHYIKLFDEKKHKEMLDPIRLMFLLTNSSEFKSVILHNLGDEINSKEWSYLNFALLHNILLHLTIPKKLQMKVMQNDGLETFEETILKTIASALRFSVYDPANRSSVFKKLYPTLLENERSISYYIGKVVFDVKC